jgi:hypothetical protein
MPMSKPATPASSGASKPSFWDRLTGKS